MNKPAPLMAICRRCASVAVVPSTALSIAARSDIRCHVATCTLADSCSPDASRRRASAAVVTLTALPIAAR